MGGAGCGLSVWRVGRDRGEAESHSRAEDNVVGWRRGGEGRSVRCGACAGGVRTGWVCVCVCVCVCVWTRKADSKCVLFGGPFAAVIDGYQL